MSYFYELYVSTGCQKATYMSLQLNKLKNMKEKKELRNWKQKRFSKSKRLQKEENKD